MTWLADPEIWVSFLTLSVMEIVLGIDNVVFISVLTSRLPEPQATRARQIGLALALIFRVVMLLGLTWLIGLTQPLFTLAGHAFSWRDLILMLGGLFLLYKATTEIHKEIEEASETPAGGAVSASFAAIISQIVVIDLVFSIDSIITAIGMAQVVGVMVAAIIVAVAIMYAASGPVSEFIHRHPSTKMLALSFLMLIGVSLVADSIGFHIPRGYIYFAMAFSALVEIVNILARRKRERPRPLPTVHWSRPAVPVEQPSAPKTTSSTPAS